MNASNRSFSDLFPKNADIIDDGVWFDLGQGTRLKINRIDNRGFQGFAETVRKANKFQFDHELLSEEAKIELLIPGVARHLLLDWEQFPPEKPEKYSPAIAEKLMRESHKFCRSVIEMANQNKAFVRDFEESAGKNSQGSSTGS